MRAALIPFALSEAGKVVTVREVSRGAACNCTCPGCGAPLIARQGDYKAWAFAHASGSDCKHAYESSLHLAVKTIIEQEKRLYLPPCYVSTRHDSPVFEPLQGYYCVGDYLYRPTPMIQNLSLEGYAAVPSRQVHFDRVDLEQVAGDMRPDIIASVGKTQLYIEVAVTHFVDQAKLDKIIARGVSTIEIDVSDIHQTNWNWDYLRNRVIAGLESKRWLFNKKVQALADQNRSVNLDDQAKYLGKEIVKKADYEATHEVRFFTDREEIIVVSMSRLNVRIYMLPGLGPRENEVLGSIANRYQGTYNAIVKQWELKPRRELFFSVAHAIHNAPFVTQIIQERHPDNLGHQSFTNAIKTGKSPYYS